MTRPATRLQYAAPGGRTSRNAALRCVVSVNLLLSACHAPAVLHLHCMGLVIDIVQECLNVRFCAAIA